MGALHEGHLQLCDVARRHADAIVVSVFVNPLQFAPGEDFDRYPRDLDRDARLIAGRGAAVLFAPDNADVYPEGATEVRVHAPVLGDMLCGRFRPGHFEGVLTMVAKLFNMTRPDSAVFGRKDLQQAALIRRMVRDLNFGIDVIVAPTVREADGLAMSSRNVYLSALERRSALALHSALNAGQQAFIAGESNPAGIAAAAAAILEAEPGVSVQYVEVVDPESLLVPRRVERGHAVAVAGYVGKTRLIDNHILE
jgi:pantoate--beta-alanine ligase